MSILEMDALASGVRCRVSKPSSAKNSAKLPSVYFPVANSSKARTMTFESVGCGSIVRVF
ncbi:MAG: hypothetical protein A3A28_03445 [Candidatus Sungbacteria bacterium RIFCSPLOWO2_01_FULL_47_32]|nr:MAG: hypothetical protein A3A28_03445 [Candidatus Sungbacteria bacterium RIFCSPLOWO2_01_FULL_47_32]